MTILLVCDDAGDPGRREEQLRPLDHVILRAATTNEATRTLETASVDLVILVGGGTGGDPVARLGVLRRQSRQEGLPFLLLARPGECDDARALEAGWDDVVAAEAAAPILCARARNLLRRKRAHDGLVAANEECRRVSALHAELTELLIHDMRAPIAGASVNVEVALDLLGPASGVVPETLQDALLAVHRVLNLTEEVILLARLDEARAPIAPVPVAVRGLVDDTLRILSRTVQRRRVALEVAVDDSASVIADPGLLRRVVENLVDNAFRHVPGEGRVLIRVVERRGGTELHVGNTGAPIPPGERTRIFDKYARVPSAAAGASNAGLGLHFCHVVASAHGGEISVQETEEWPVLFVVRLPGGGPAEDRPGGQDD